MMELRGYGVYRYRTTRSVLHARLVICTLTYNATHQSLVDIPMIARKKELLSRDYQIICNF